MLGVSVSLEEPPSLHEQLDLQSVEQISSQACPQGNVRRQGFGQL